MEARFESERELEFAIAAHPEVLPCEDLGIGSLIALGTQIDLGSGPMDLLAADADGRLAIIEFKRGSENPDVRKVVAQLLDYGSTLWRRPYEQLAIACNRGSDAAGNGLEGIMAAGCARLSLAFDPEAFRVGVETALDAGDFVFVYVGRDLDERSRRIMTFLAEGPRMTFFAVEVAYYRGGDADRAVLVPRVAFVPTWISGKPAATRRLGRTSVGLAEAPPETMKLLALMDDLAAELGLVVKQARTGRNYEPSDPQPGAKYASGIGVYATSRGLELNLQVFRDLGAGAEADHILEKLRIVTRVDVTAGGWPAIACERVRPFGPDLHRSHRALLQRQGAPERIRLSLVPAPGRRCRSSPARCSR